MVLNELSTIMLKLLAKFGIPASKLAFWRQKNEATKALNDTKEFV
jgi:hypothetical protein